MNGRSGILLMLALACGLGAMYGVRKLLSRPQPSVKFREVLAAARDLKTEEVLKPDMVKVLRMPEASVPAGAFSSFKDVAERWVRLPMLADDVIVEAKLAPRDAPIGLLPRIPDGMRAFAVEVNEQTGVSGFILPDHRVDVVLAYNSTNRAGRPQSETILQDVQVLAVGQITSRPEDKSIQVRTVTLALTPQEVDTLVAAKTEGSLTLALRGLHDHTKVEVKPAPAHTEETRPIVVAAVPLKRGTVLKPNHLKVEPMARSTVLPADVFAEVGPIVGRVVRTDMAAQEPMLAAKLAAASDAGADDAPDQAFTPGKGLRAVPLKVETLSGGLGPIRRGDFVDILWTRAKDDKAGASETVSVPTGAGSGPGRVDAEILLQRVRVLAAPADANLPTDPARPVGEARPPVADLVILEVPAVEVAHLLQRQADGKLTLVSRDRDDVGVLDRPKPVAPEQIWIHHGPRLVERLILSEGRVERAAPVPDRPGDLAIAGPGPARTPNGPNP